MRIAIVGGGAAGMMCAATLIEHGISGSDILLFEKNKGLGAKVIISGGGRCNLTTGLYAKKELLAKYPRGKEMLKHAFKKFGPKIIRRWFEENGVPLKEEKDGRIFPISNDGKDVVGVFSKLFAKHNTDLHFEEGVDKIIKDKNGVYTVTTSKSTYKVDAVVLTTGGNAYAHTGSTGDGYAFARGLGHTITPLGPSLNSFKTVEEYLYSCSGIAFPTAKINAAGTVTVGPVLLTHFGVTGPAIFAFSSLIPYEKISPESPYQIKIQPIAAKGYEQRQRILLDASQSHPKKELCTILREFFPRKFVDTILSHHGISSQMKLADLTKVQRKCISKEFGEGFTLQLKQRRPGDEFVTAGGVPLTEVNHKTAESLVSPGLYFAGEILDIDGYTGGYNLSSSWAVGKMAADAIAKSG